MVVCGRLWSFAGGLSSFVLVCGGLWSFVFVPCFSKILEEIHVATTIETLTLVLDINGKHTLLILLYRPPGTIHSFVTDLIQLIENVLSTVNVTRILLIGDFNLGQVLQENVNKMHPLTQRFHLHQRSQYSTHVQGGMLDLVFDSRKSESILWIPSPYSDILLFALTFNDHSNAQNVLQFQRDKVVKHSSILVDTSP